MNPDLAKAGKKFRRKVAREFRAAFNRLREENRRAWPCDPQTARAEVIWAVSGAARMSSDRVRGFIFGGKDLDVESMGRLARALGLKPAPSLMEDEKK